MVLGTRRVTDQGVRAELSHFVSRVGGNTRDRGRDRTRQAAALDSGARGYILGGRKAESRPGAIGLVAGGIRTTSGVWRREMIRDGKQCSAIDRHLHYARNLCCSAGKNKANKIINTSSTSASPSKHSQYHEKLKASNRTEVAYNLGRWSSGTARAGRRWALRRAKISIEGAGNRDPVDSRRRTPRSGWFCADSLVAGARLRARSAIPVHRHWLRCSSLGGLLTTRALVGRRVARNASDVGRSQR